MFEQDPEASSNNILFDYQHNIRKNGVHSGSIILKMKNKADSIIFSDTVEITDNLIEIEGLKVGINGSKAESQKGNFSIDIPSIEFCVKIDEEIVRTFENERFNASFPYMISLLNTSLLFNSINKNIVNHFEFVQGEIINHPIGLLFNNSIIIGDRMVVDDLNHPVFYDAFLISRKAYDVKPTELYEFSYEPIRRLDINYIKYIIILGVEMLK